MHDLARLTVEELRNLRSSTQRRLEENKANYDRHHSDQPSGYAYGITDDYNGEGAEYAGLNELMFEIDRELRSRGV